jgi:hypothetical protein
LAICGLSIAIAFLSGCGEPNKDGYIRIENGKFVRAGKEFFPVVMNMVVSLVDNGTECWPATYGGYNVSGRFAYTDRDSTLMQLRSEWMLLRQLGFNTVRVVILTEGPSVFAHKEGPQLRAHSPEGIEHWLPMGDTAVQQRYLGAVDALMDIARGTGMYVILLSTIHHDRPGSKEHFTLLADHLRTDTMVLAFDLFNEPLYFDKPQRSKTAVYKIVREWRELAHEHAPEHLITIGLTGIREVHRWDPHILDVDFISFHPYEYEPDQVLNEISWYGRHVRKPWMIGETSLPADNDSVSYEDQIRFARRTLDQVRACGGIGYSWWQFKDVRWSRFHADYMGLLEMEGTIEVPSAPLSVTGSVKPVASVFTTFNPLSPIPQEEKLSNYLNYSAHRTSRLTGRLLDMEGRPIEGGVVLAWNRNFTHSYHTTTGPDGSFELKGDMLFHHWTASALEHETLISDVHPSAFRRDAEGTASFSLGELRLEGLGLTP